MFPAEVGPYMWACRIGGDTSPAFLIPVLNKWTGMNIQTLPYLPGPTNDFLVISIQRHFTDVITLLYELNPLIKSRSASTSGEFCP
jgi:hypothetical protein